MHGLLRLRMEKLSNGLRYSVVLFVLFLQYQAVAQENISKRAEWFVEDRFGMFIHWGIYTGAEGVWKGEKLRNDNDYAEWIQYRNQIPKDEYVKLLDRFSWEDIDPEKWVIAAKKAGMKYVTLTAKHHDGFALWDSKVTTYDIANYTNNKRDIVKELAEACKKHGLKLGLYYSHWIDWEDPNAWDHAKELEDFNSEDFDIYWQQKVIPQITELLTNYGDIGMLWFDMWINHSETVVTKKQLLQLKELIRKLQPDCLINSRLGLSIEEDPDVDYRTLGDNQLGETKLEYPWQTPATVAHSWGYNRLENQWKSTTSLLKNIIGNVSLNGNLMLNIGPRANGDIPFEITSRLRDIGAWLDVNGASIYGSGAFDLKANIHNWGQITAKEEKGGSYKIYLHVYNWPLNSKLPVTGIKEAPQKIYLLSDKQRKALEFKHDEVFTNIDLPRKAPDNFVSVVVMEFNKKPEVEKDLVAISDDGGFSLKSENAVASKGNSSFVEAERFGTIPPHARIKGIQEYRWKVYIDTPGEYRLDVSYNLQEESKAKVDVKVSNEALQYKFVPTGKTIGEPNQQWGIDRYLFSSIGNIEVEKPGFYTISATFDAANSEVDFNWLWFEKID